jgi:predicted ArsR family transcriptional regulator
MLYSEQSFTMEQIATQLGVSQNTISLDLRNLSTVDKLKPAKTASNPKGAGRPKGTLKPERRINTSPVGCSAVARTFPNGLSLTAGFKTLMR